MRASLASTGSDVGSLSLPLFLAGFFPPVNTARLVCGTRDLHVSRRPATVRWYHGFVWREA